VIREGRTVGFRVGAYDRTVALVIDPTFTLGGGNDDQLSHMALGPDGAVYLTGTTKSTNFPVVGGVQSGLAGAEDVFVTKLMVSNVSATIVYSTYLGGNNSEFSPAIAVGSDGSAHVAGTTQSTNFPVLNAIQATSAGLADFFVTKLSADGSALVYSTYLGGAGFDEGFAIAVDADDNAYVAGFAGAGLPTTSGVLQTAPAGGFDGYVAKLNPAGSAIVWATYLGGAGFDVVTAIAVDTSGNVYVTGATGSSDFPTTTGAFQRTCGGCGALNVGDAFVTKLNATGSALVYSTFLGGSTGTDPDDFAEAIAVDAAGNAHVVGSTHSTNFPTTIGAPQTVFWGGDQDAFVTKLNPTGTALVYSTYLGGNGYEVGEAILLDENGRAYVVGGTSSTNFPTRNPTQATYGGGISDVFITVLNPSGTLTSSTYFGRTGGDFGRGVALTSNGEIIVAGFSSSSSLPPGALSPDPNNLLNELFAAILGAPLRAPADLMMTISGENRAHVGASVTYRFTVSTRVSPSGD
jgi:hypothetical protein